MKRLICFSIVFCVSCTVESPQFLVTGIQVPSAVSFIQEFQQGEKTTEQFNHYTQLLRSGHAPGFEWDTFWSAITEQELYKNMNGQSLDYLLSLSELSCREEHQSAFIGLLFKMADSTGKLLFRDRLSFIRKTCSNMLSDTNLKAIVSFLNQNRIQNSAYTEELQKVLTDEWSANPRVRNWNDILSAVDRSFYGSARLINYQNKDWAYLDSTLQMEWSVYQKIKNLEQDIVLMFEQEGKMADLLDLSEYKKYFSGSDSVLDWSSVWEAISQQYPEKPENGNVPALLSLYSFSCKETDLPAYLSLLESWNEPDYKLTALRFCQNAIGMAYKEGSYSSYKAVAELLQSAPAKLVSISVLLALYEREKHTRSVNEWRTLLDYISQENWRHIISALRLSGSRSDIARVLDMYVQVYQQSAPEFLIKDIMDVVFSPGESIMDLKYSYPQIYLNHPQTLKLFWAEVEKRQINQPPTASQLTANPVMSLTSDKCDYPYIRRLLQFFSESGKKEILLEQFTFENCLDFLQDFKDREWLVLVRRARAINKRSIQDKDINLVWWMARVLSLYPLADVSSPSPVAGFSLKEAVYLLTEEEWEKVFHTMIVSLNQPADADDVKQFTDTLKTVRSVYAFAGDLAVCWFFNQKNSHLLIQEYNPSVVIGLFDQVNWSEWWKDHGTHKGKVRSRINMIRKDRLCAGIVPSKKINTLLFVLAHSFIKSIPVSNNDSEYGSYFFQRIYRLIDLFLKVKTGEFNFMWVRRYCYRYLCMNKIVEGQPRYNARQGHMNDRSFELYFQALYLRELLSFSSAQERVVSLEDILDNMSVLEDFAGLHTLNEVYNVRDIIQKSFYPLDNLRQWYNPQREGKMNLEEELNLIEQDLGLSK